jgi:hypothetical protein
VLAQHEHECDYEYHQYPDPYDYLQAGMPVRGVGRALMCWLDGGSFASLYAQVSPRSISDKKRTCPYDLDDFEGAFGYSQYPIFPACLVVIRLLWGPQKSNTVARRVVFLECLAELADPPARRYAKIVYGIS